MCRVHRCETVDGAMRLVVRCQVSRSAMNRSRRSKVSRETGVSASARSRSAGSTSPGSCPIRARVWIDLGAGGGFPGLVIACALAGQPGAHVHLVESNTKKAAFLREAQRLTEAPASVHAVRIEDFAARFEGAVDIVTARAVAPLKSLLDQCFSLLGKSGAMGLFPKGQNAELELRQARESRTGKAWTMNATLAPSRTDPAGRIIVIRDVERSSTTP